MKAEEKNYDKVYAGLPYLYRTKGLPSEVYEVRLKKNVEENVLELAIQDALERYPYFNVRFEEKDGDFYSVINEEPLKAIKSKEQMPLGGTSNNGHMIGITYYDNVLRLAFHHGLTDGRGMKNFLETLMQYYAEYDSEENRTEEGIKRVQELHKQKVEELSVEEYMDPCEKKYEIDKKVKKVEGIATKGFTLPELEKKSGHRRYELRFSQEEFMSVCKSYGASPISFLSILMSKAIQKVHPDNNKPIISNFPMDARNMLGMDKTFKNCVKSMSLSYGEEEKELPISEVAKKYKELLNAQKDRDYCAKEFNNIVMLLGVIQHFRSFKSRQKILKFMENLTLDTFLISYIGQFDVPGDYVDSVHLYSSCADGLVLNMTCQSGYFVIDMVQDFESSSYVAALKEMFVNENVHVEVSEEIIFETPYDEMAENIVLTTTNKQSLEEWIESFVSYNKEAAQRANLRKEQSLALSKSLNERYGGGNAYGTKNYLGQKMTVHTPEIIRFQDVATGKTYAFDSSKFTKGELEKLLIEE